MNYGDVYGYGHFNRYNGDSNISQYIVWENEENQNLSK